MCQSRTLNKKINKLHERALRLVYGVRHATLTQLCNTDKSVIIHQRNLQVPPTKMYKVHHGLSPECMNGIFFRKKRRTILEKNQHLK